MARSEGRVVDTRATSADILEEPVRVLVSHDLNPRLAGGDP